MGFASWQRYCTAVKYWASAKLCGVEQRAPPVFGRAAITLGIGPHSSVIMFILTVWANLHCRDFLFSFADIQLQLYQSYRYRIPLLYLC